MRHKKVGGIRQSIAPITEADEIRAKLLARMAAIQREVLAAAQSDDELFDAEPPDDLR